MMSALVLLGINQHTKFEVSGFTNSKDMIEAKFKENGSRDPDHTLGSSLSSKAKHWIYSVT